MECLKLVGMFFICFLILGTKCKTQTQEHQTEVAPLVPSEIEEIGCLINIEGTQMILSEKEVADKNLHGEVLECLPLDLE